MAASQIQGFTAANIAEVEANTRALRVTLRAEDFGSLGAYSVGSISGVMAAGLAANAPIWSCRWTDATRLCIIKRVTFSAGCGATGFTAGAGLFNLFVARSYSAVDSGGTSVLPTGNAAKLRTTGMGTTLMGDMRIASTGTLTAGTRSLDANGIGSIAAGIIAGAGAPIVVPPWPMFDQRPGEYPLVLAQNEGLVLQGTVPVTGTWQFGVKIDWLELTAY